MVGDNHEQNNEYTATVHEEEMQEHGKTRSGDDTNIGASLQPTAPLLSSCMCEVPEHQRWLENASQMRSWCMCFWVSDLEWGSGGNYAVWELNTWSGRRAFAASTWKTVWSFGQALDGLCLPWRAWEQGNALNTSMKNFVFFIWSHKPVRLLRASHLHPKQ